MPQYSIWKALFMSFYSARLYQDIGRNWKGIGLKYILLLCTITCVFMSVSWMLMLKNADTEKYADWATRAMFENPNLTFEENLNRMLNIASQVPLMSIDDGTLTSEEPSPYFITDPFTKKNIAIIDTSGEYNSLEESDALILLTKTRIITRKKDGSEEVVYLSSLKEEQSMKEKDVNNILGVIAQIPLITITDGIASMDAASPYFIHDSDNKEIAAIDMDGNYDNIDNVNAGVLITKDKLFIRDPLKKENREFYLSEINADTIFSGIHYVLDSLRSVLLKFIPTIVTPVFILASFVLTILITLLYGMIGLIMAKFLKLEKMEIQDTIRIAAVALTPMAFANLLLPQLFPNQGVIYFLITIGYIFFGVRANVAENQQ